MMKKYKSILLLFFFAWFINSNAKTISKDSGFSLFSKINSSFVFLNAPSYSSTNDEYKEINYPENISKFRNAVIFSILITISFLINIPFFLKWAKKQKGSDEVLLYNVEGNFTYLTILLWIERLEFEHGTILHKERKKIESFYSVVQKGKVSIKIYKRKVHDILMIKAFGQKMIRTAFSRMGTYSKITFLMDIAIYLSIIYASICLLSIDYSWLASIFTGVFIGNIIAAPIWLVCHLIFNHFLKSLSRKEIKKGDGIGLRIIMAHFYGAFGGVIWKDLYYIQGKSSWTNGRLVTRGANGANIPQGGDNSRWSYKEAEKDLDFDKD